jgi:DNA repair protein RadC
MINYKNSLTIKQWNEDDQPREKLLSKGIIILSDAELIAILIGSGNRQESAVELAKRILKSINNNLLELAKLTTADLMKFKGIGEAKAISIITALELGRRRRLEEALAKPKISSSKSVFEVMQPIIGDLQHEEFWIIYLNNANKIQLKTQMSKGGITGTLVDTRLVFKRAMEITATSVILCHNHPSGTLKPSSSDISLTKKIKEGGEILDIKVLDHVIITEGSYYSFADEGIL